MNRQFSALRGIAIVLVVFHHAVDLTRQVAELSGAHPLSGISSVVLRPIWELGIYAVPIFLFVSGAFMAYVGRGEPPNLSSTVARNGITRLLWPYLFWTAVLHVEIYFHYGELYSISELVKRLIVGAPFHFVPLLIFFYAISPLLLRVARGRRGYALLGVVFVLQLLITKAEGIGTLGIPLPAWLPDDVPVLGPTLATWAVFYPLGLVFGVNATDIKRRLRPWRRPLLFLCLMAFGVRLLVSYGIIAGPWSTLLATCAAMLYLPFIERNAIPAVHLFERISKRSYGLYLVHFILIDALLFAASSASMAIFRLQFLLVLVTFLLGLAVPLLVMENVAKLHPARSVYRYVFG